MLTIRAPCEAVGCGAQAEFPHLRRFFSPRELMATFTRQFELTKTLSLPYGEAGFQPNILTIILATLCQNQDKIPYTPWRATSPFIICQQLFEA